jgi:hypothetical protein
MRAIVIDVYIIIHSRKVFIKIFLFLPLYESSELSWHQDNLQKDTS